jgi:glycosyltransferase involved in cell wall biosynthesis
VFQLDGNDNDLAKLYSSATALIYPSLYEGFGLPPLEAMKYGCPVIASNAASIPEICHDSAIYFDPLNTEQISTTIETTLGNEDLLRSKVQLGFQNEKRFTWKKTAIETLQVYCDLFK